MLPPVSTLFTPNETKQWPMANCQLAMVNGYVKIIVHSENRLCGFLTALRSSMVKMH